MKQIVQPGYQKAFSTDLSVFAFTRIHKQKIDLVLLSKLVWSRSLSNKLSITNVESRGCYLFDPDLESVFISVTLDWPILVHCSKRYAIVISCHLWFVRSCSNLLLIHEQNEVTRSGG